MLRTFDSSSLSSSGYRSPLLDIGFPAIIVISTRPRVNLKLTLWEYLNIFAEVPKLRFHKTSSTWDVVLYFYFNKILKILVLTKHEAKDVITIWLLKFAYDETEKLLTISLSCSMCFPMK